MIAAIIRWSLRFPLVVCALAAMLAVYGVLVVAGAKYDVFPEFVPPQAAVQTEAPGLVAEQVELLVTLPIEQAISGASGVQAVRSETISGLSVVTVVFQENVDPYCARQIVAEALGQVTSRLPLGVKPPKLEPLTSSTMDLLKLGFVSERLSPMQLRDLVQWTMRPRLLAVPGVARATLYGGDERQLQVQVEPRELNARDLAFSDGVAPKFGDTLIMGKPGVLLNLSSQYGANTLIVTRALEAALAELAPALRARGVTLYGGLHRPANFIETALAGIRLDVVLGAVLITLVLFLFLRDLRSVLVAFVSIPLALLAAVIAVDAVGWTINTMTLGGLAVALGVVVDDAIIGVENIVRRLRGTHAHGSEAREIIQDASVEVRAPVVYATFVVVLVLAPMLMLSGLQGSFFGPLAASFSLATLASLIVALTVTPAAALLLLTRTRRGSRG